MALAIDDDFGVRFQKLRDAGALPRSVGSNARPLSTLEIATAVLSLVPTKPGSPASTLSVCEVFYQLEEQQRRFVRRRRSVRHWRPSLRVPNLLTMCSK
jgi:hypothetical protein